MTVTQIGHPELPSYLRFEQGKIYGGDEAIKQEAEIDDEPALFALQLLDPRIYLILRSAWDFWIDRIDEQEDGSWRVTGKYVFNSRYLKLNEEFLGWFGQQANLKRNVAFFGRAEQLEGMEQSDFPPYEGDRIFLRLE